MPIHKFEFCGVFLHASHGLGLATKQVTISHRHSLLCAQWHLANKDVLIKNRSIAGWTRQVAKTEYINRPLWRVSTSFLSSGPRHLLAPSEICRYCTRVTEVTVGPTRVELPVLVVRLCNDALLDGLQQCLAPSRRGT